MVRRTLIVVCLGFMAAFMTSCGQTYKLVSISVSPSTGYSLTQFGETGQLTVTATYSNSKTSVVTTGSMYTINAPNLVPAPLNAPLTAFSVNNSGLVEASSSVPACSYAATTSGGTTTYTPTPYPVAISYTEDGVTRYASVPILVSTGSPCIQ